MLRSKILLLGSIVLCCYVSVAQQDPQFSHFFVDQLSVNPAYAGSNDMVNASAINRQQFMRFPGAPVSSGLAVHSPVKPFGLNSGVGLNILVDNYGYNQDIGLNLAWAQRFTIQRVGTLALGVGAGFINNTFDFSDGGWRTPSGATGDPSIPQENLNSMNLDLSFGLFFSNNEMFFGLSGTHLNETPSNAAEVPSYYRRHFYLTGGYNLKVGDSPWEFRPSALVATTLTTNQFAFTANMVYNKRVWAGMQYRIGDAVSALFGFELFNGLRIGCAYDIQTTDIIRNSNGSLEFMIGYGFTLRKEKPPQQYKSIRFL